MTNEEIIENGRRLFQSAENLRQSALDLDALLDTVWEVTEHEELFGQIEDLRNEDGGGPEEWLAPAFALNAKVLTPPKKKTNKNVSKKNASSVGTLTFIVRLCNSVGAEDNDVNWPWLDQACLILGWHPREHADDNWEIENFDPEDENLAAIVHVGNGLWAWREDNGNYAYFFVVPIFSFRNEVDLKQFALRPLKSLFYSEDPVSAAEEALRGVPVLLPYPA